MTRGRPRQHWTVPVHVWAMVELLRDREQPNLPRRSARSAAKSLAAKMSTYGDFEEETLRRLHKNFERELRAEYGEGYAKKVDDLLREYRQRRAERGWKTHPLEIVLI